MRSVTADLLLQRLNAQAPSGPRNRRLYEALRAAILDGSLPPRSRLPASRDLAAELGLSRNTVLHAYEQLQAEGYLHTRVGSGTFVAETAPDRFLHASRAVPAAPHAGLAPRLAQRARTALERASAFERQWGAFMPGVPDVRQFPNRHFARLLARLWRSPEPALLTYANGGGDMRLREALAQHLRVARSVRCEPEQLLITEGVHQAIEMAVKMLVDPGETVWVEDPGYWGFHSVLRMDPAITVRAIPVDEQGMRLPVEDGAPSPRLVFVTPSHQYPLGPVMSMARRQELLAFARSRNAWIVEDDYDSEFRFGGHPIPAVQGLEENPPVIYIGTFSKTLFPGLRVGYMVLPRELAAAFRSVHADLYREGHAITQRALAHLIEDGHYAAHIRRMRVLYARRRALLVELIEQHLSSACLHTQDSNAGLHLVLRLPAHVNDAALAQDLIARGILTRPLSRYYLGDTTARGLLLGYACVEEADITPAFHALRQGLAEHGI
ncbi:PLP-dependent aminotransferase family protein [Verticiella sediminum]|uniref:PLP-dependent aminotransferase family protein n=1 Tax=Verticiella sediminum TaxID=1247510 RepID=A0A556AGX3_9BURK|nr:PLP-dependent aminotransferase family protein [Verticiella sediminum]TSH92113.1 PLP-dependent aminotransferase family protein [Verticiella sediminum]